MYLLPSESHLQNFLIHSLVSFLASADSRLRKEIRAAVKKRLE